ncbi:MAG: diacylglycerol/lipid kinase family protein [Pirellulaceae bacterium]
MARSIRYISPDARRVLLLLNAKAGARDSRQRVADLRRRLERAAMQVEEFSVCDLPALSQAVGPSPNASLRAVVAAGGDGTVSAAVNHTPPETPIALLPLGTENLMAKYLQQPFSPDELSEMLVHGAHVGIDAGRANHRLFLLMVGCGFDADVVHRLHATRHGHIRHASYIKPILESIRRYEYPQIQIYCDTAGGAGQGEAAPVSQSCGTTPTRHVARWAFVVNLPQYAGGLQMMPDAVGTDGWLDVCLFQHGSLIQGLRYITGILRGRHRGWEDFVHLRVRRLRIESDGLVPYQLDGDPGGRLPVDVSVLPSRVRMVVTETWALQHGYRHASTTTTTGQMHDETAE